MTTTRDLMPNGHLFYSPLGLYPFQGEAVAHAYLRENLVCVVDRGLGKTVIFMALAAQLIEDGEIDLVINVAQANKLEKEEFPKDWATFTSLRAHRYLGTGRTQRLAKALDAGPVDVIMTTYETGKLDLMTWEKTKATRGKGSRVDGPLVEQLGLRGKRILWVFDEVVKLANRGNDLYRAYEYIIGQLRRGPHKQRVIGMSANPMSTDYIQSENIALIVDPSKVPNITTFKKLYTYGQDDHGGYLYKAAAREEFAPMFQQIQYRKRNTDPDVRHLVPQLDELPLINVALDPMHRALYDAVQSIYGPWQDLDDNRKGQVSSALRLVAGHPRAVVRSESVICKAVVDTLGREVIESIPSSKTLRLLKELQTLQGKQVLIFTFWSDTVLPEVMADLLAAGHKVAAYIDPGDRASRLALQMFKAGEIDILISGDAGARGLNVPEARYIIEYESARTFETRMQRFGRGTRITSDAEFVYGMTLVARGTVEVGTIHGVLERNDTQDHLLGDKNVEGYIDSGQRRKILQGVRA